MKTINYQSENFSEETRQLILGHRKIESLEYKTIHNYDGVKYVDLIICRAYCIACVHFYLQYLDMKTRGHSLYKVQQGDLETIEQFEKNTEICAVFKNELRIKWRRAYERIRVGRMIVEWVDDPKYGQKDYTGPGMTRDKYHIASKQPNSLQVLDEMLTNKGAFGKSIPKEPKKPKDSKKLNEQMETTNKRITDETNSSDDHNEEEFPDEELKVHCRHINNALKDNAVCIWVEKEKMNEELQLKAKVLPIDEKL